MTLDEARTVLDVSADASAAEIRAAYTGLIKRHKPDKDPHGFRRVREAFELLGARSARASVPAPAPAPAPGTELPAPRPPPVVTETPPEDLELAEAQRVLDRKLASVGLTRADALRLLRAHLAEYPHDDLARELLVRALGRGGDVDEARDVLIAGALEGREPRHFAAELALWVPTSLRGDELRAIADDARWAPYAVVALAARGAGDEAARLARATLAADHARGTPRGGVWLRVVAGLFERGADALAREVHAALTGIEVPDRAAALLVRDLADVAPKLAPQLVRALGGFLATPMRNARELEHFRVEEQRWRQDLATLRAAAPQLAKIAFPWGDTVRTQPLDRGRKLILAVFACMMLSPLLAPYVIPLPAPRTRSAESAMLCDDADTWREYCRDALTIDLALQEEDCDSAIRAHGNLLRTYDRSPRPELVPALNALVARIDGACE